MLLSQVTLDQVISLYETLEKRRFDTVKDQVKKDFKDESIKDKIHSELKEIFKEKNKIPSKQETVDALIKFIFRCLVEGNLDAKNQKLRDYICRPDFWEEELNNADKPMALSQLLDNEFTLS
jgi:hypothetical protein